MPRPGIRLIQTASCLKNCQSPQSCSTKEEIRNQIMSLPDDCKQCVNETCGKQIYVHKKDVSILLKKSN